MRRLPTLNPKRPLELATFESSAAPTVILARADLVTYDLLSAANARELSKALAEAADLIDPPPRIPAVLPPVVPAVDRRQVELPPAGPREDGVMFRVTDRTPRDDGDDWHGVIDAAGASA